MGPALAIHDRLLRQAVESARGTVIKTTGDGLLAVFDDQVDAVGAAVAAQRALRDVVGVPSARSGSGWRSIRAPPNRATGTTSGRP